VVAQRGTCFQVAPFNGCDRLQHTFDSLSNTHRDHHTSTSEGSPEHLQHTISAGSAWPFFLYLIYCDAAITLGVDFGTVSRSVAFAAPNFGFQWFNRPSGRAPAASPRFREIRCSASGRQGVSAPDLDWLASEPPWCNRLPMQGQGGNLVFSCPARQFVGRADTAISSDQWQHHGIQS
jgi:hypothetical protein